MKSLCKISVLFLLVFFITHCASAQVVVVKGFLRDSVTLFPIIKGTIINSATKTTVKSDDNGFFKIDVSPSDVLYASAKSYQFDTLKYSLMFTDTVTIFLPFSGNVLPTVTVKGQYTRYQLDSLERRKDFEKKQGTVLKTLANNHPSGFGLTFNLDKAFKKKSRDQRASEKVFTVIEKTTYIDYRFSPNLVAYYTGLKGDRLKDFINYCSPSFEWLRLHPTNEDVLYYINDKLKLYKATKLR